MPPKPKKIELPGKKTQEKKKEKIIEVIKFTYITIPAILNSHHAAPVSLQ